MVFNLERTQKFIVIFAVLSVASFGLTFYGMLKADMSDLLRTCIMVVSSFAGIIFLILAFTVHAICKDMKEHLSYIVGRLNEKKE